MNSLDSTEIKARNEQLLFCKHIQRIQSITDMRYYKCLLNFNTIKEQYLAANVQKILLFCQQNQNQNQSKMFLSINPYIKQNGKLVYLLSNRNFAKGIFSEEDSTLRGPKIIAILKNMYNSLYSEQQTPSQDFKQIADYIIDHNNDFTHNLISGSQLSENLLQFQFVLKNSLRARINKSRLMKRLNNIFLIKNQYSELIRQSFNTQIDFKNCSQHNRTLIFQNLQKFFMLCTKDKLFIFPAKRTLDSKFRSVRNQNNQHLIISVATKQKKKSVYKQTQTFNKFDERNDLQHTQIMFSLIKKVQNNQQFILIKLETDFNLSGAAFVFFQAFFNNILEKYIDLYLKNLFNSSFEENINKTKPQLRNKQLKLDFVHKIFLKKSQNIISSFIKAVDILIIIYLVFQEFLINVEEQNYLQNIMTNLSMKKREIIENDIAIDLYNFIKTYLESFTQFKRKYFFPHQKV